MINPIFSDTLLTYNISTMPSPLQVSETNGATSYAAMNVVISNNRFDSALMLSEVSITIPVGENAGDLTETPAGISPTVSPSTVWTVTSPTPGVFTIQPTGGKPVNVTKEGIIIQLANIAVNTEVGSPDVDIVEKAEGTGEPLQDRTAQFQVGKFPYGFYFSNFSPGAPMVSDGQTVTLTWLGSDTATYEMFWDDKSEDVTDVRSWISKPLNNDTTFMLNASVVLGEETVVVTLTTTVTVGNPEITATSLTVSGITQLEGYTMTSNLTANGTLVSTGVAALSTVTAAGMTADTLTLNKNLTLGGAAFADFSNMNVGGTVDSLNLNASGNLRSYNYTTLQGNTLDVSATTSNFTGSTVNITGAAIMQNTSIMSELLLKGTARILRKPYNQNVNTIQGNGTYTATAKTDMLITANVSPSAKVDENCFGYVSIYSEGVGNNAAGGNIYGPDKTYYSLNGACSSFIRKGQSFTLTVRQDTNNKEGKYVYWAFYVWEIGSADTTTAAETTEVTNVAPEVQDSVKANLDTDRLAGEIMKSVKAGDEKALADVLRKILRVEK